ncbi:MAG: hypothetical protein AAGD05_11145, partial [Bacteroidota bacterium]
GGTPIHLQRHFPFEAQFIQTLIQLLGPTSKCHFYIAGNFHFEQIDPQYAQAWFMDASFSYLITLYQQLNESLIFPFPLLPQYVLAEQRDWAIASGKIPGGHYLLLACSDAIRPLLEQQTPWSVIPRAYDDRYL